MAVMRKETPSTAMSAPRNQSMNITLDTPVTTKVIRGLVSVMCLVHRNEQTDELDKVYYLALSDLTMGQAAELAELIPRETKMWPSPRALRELLGIPSIEEKRAADAGAALGKVLDSLRMVRSDPRQLERWLIEADRKKANDDSIGRIVKALDVFGAGDLKTAVEILMQHPRLRSASYEAEAMGLELSAIEKVEHRWARAWREVNR